MKLFVKVIILFVIVTLAGLGYWLAYGHYFQSTDNAYTHTDIISVSARMNGQIVQSLVQDNQRVHQGDVLARLDDRAYRINVQQAQATLAQRKAELANARATLAMQKSTILEHRNDVASAKARYDNAEHELKRTGQLSKQKYVSGGDMDHATLSYKVTHSEYKQAKASLKTQEDKLVLLTSEIASAEAGVKQAEAALSHAQLMLSYTQITAPADGVVSNRHIQVGMMIQAGQSVLSLVSEHPPWIEANFKETQITHMHKGQPVEVAVDAYPEKTFKATVDSIAPATGATFALLPPDNTTGNFTKVVQRVPVKIVFNDPVHLDSGLSVVVSVDTRP
ncbi:putative multidrug resistance protein EmrK [Vibrio aerogenes CECT 7868]|uniref:Putative multidrug resistance protein EmrK n=1 Tax=Vibrio aerogenes CECT 7868 TaxID=1216006 RepID=A0A1M5ZT55_9VIBR|nr:HlyD family secretion protein [Vibrio aerogenes]SHI27401.1 putative multidrug resistance protein EmrK [Vibrio aerogenes CECT 7868]